MQPVALREGYHLPASLTWKEACGRRLERSYLLSPAPRSHLAEVVSQVCGLQAQVLSAAELGLGLRVAGATRQAVQEDLWRRRRLVKTYGPRSTLHLLPAAELPLWMAAMRGRASLTAPGWEAAAGLEPGQGEALLGAIGAALDGRQFTRQSLADEVVRRTGAWAREKMESTWGLLLPPAAYAGLLCFGPSQGSRVTFVRADQWIGFWQEIDPAQALAEVCRRYFAAYGPAAHQDFGRWFGLRPAQAQQVMRMLADELEPVQVDGQQAWRLAAQSEMTPAPDPASLRLLPQYDAYILGSGQRERVVPPAVQARLMTYGRGRFEGATGLPVLLVDGAVAGLWERRARGGRLLVRVEPFVRLSAAQRRQLQAEAEGIGEFLEAEVELSVTSLTSPLPSARR